MISIKGVTLVGVFLVSLTGFWELFRKNVNHCEMTYMYQPPEYVRIDFKQPFTRQYQLFAYGEGSFADTLWHNEYHGVPVLFVPGNGGSYKQVRSLASVALVMSYASPEHHFNYFACDFNEELSAFDGEKLEAQTRFVFLAIKRILGLYTTAKSPQLIIVGHSLGGIVAKGLLTKHYFKPLLDRVVLVLTLAAPHVDPPIVFDRKTSNYYDDANSRFFENRNGSLQNINFVSIGGSSDDKLVRSDSIRLETRHEFDRSILTTAINDVWVGADHLCIVWCRQLTVKLNRIFFDLLDSGGRFIESASKRQEIIDFHLTKRRATKQFTSDRVSEFVFYSKAATWIEHQEDRLVRLNSTRVLSLTNHMIPLNARESIVLLIEGHIQPDMISVCQSSMMEQTPICTGKGLNLWNYTRLVPSSSSSQDRYEVHLRSREFIDDGHTHLVVQLSPASTSLFILIDRYTTTIRRHTLELPPFWSFVSPEETVFEKFISQPQVFYNLTFANIQHVWQTYSISVTTTSCYRLNSAFVGYGQLVSPTAELSEYMKPFAPLKYSSHNFTFQLPANIDQQHQLVNLLLYLEPNCGFRITAKFSISSMAAQIFRHYSAFFILIGISIVQLIMAVLLFNPLLIFAIPSKEYSDFLKKLPKLNKCQRLLEEKCCFIFMNIFEVMTSWRYFFFCYTQILLYIVICIPIASFFSLSHDLIQLKNYSPETILVLFTLLFVSAYSIIFVFSALIHHLSNNFSVTYNTFSRKMRIMHFVLEWKVVNALVQLRWDLIYAGWNLFLFVVLTFSFHQANLYMVHMLFTILMLAKFIKLNYSESRIGRTTTSSYIRSIFPVIYGLQLVVVLLHIPETIDAFPSLPFSTNKRSDTGGDWVPSMNAIMSITESWLHIGFYFVLLLSPNRMDSRLENVTFPKKIRLAAGGTLMLGAFLNLLFGTLALKNINYSVFLVFCVVLLQRSVLGQLLNDNKNVKED